VSEQLLKSISANTKNKGVGWLREQTVGAQLYAVAKGLVSPEDVRVGGTLRPQSASAIISMVQEDTFLSKVTTERMGRLKKDIDVYDVLARRLVRVAEGSEPSSAQIPDVDEYGCTLSALPVQLFPTLKLSTLQDNSDNPQFLQVVNGMFNTAFQNDLLDLGVNGVADDYAGSAFLKLNKGWLQVALDSANAPKLAIDPATDGWIDTLAAIRAQSDVRFRPESVFIMSPNDADAYNIELGKHVTGAAIIANSNAQGFLATQVVANRYMPDGSVLYTPLKNLVFGMHTTITRTGSFHPRKRAFEFTYDMSVDYEIAVKQACVYGKVGYTP
jgi:hypothetical protein